MPKGEINFDAGTASSGSSSTLVERTKNWTVNQWIGFQVCINGGTGNGQVGYITANTSNTLTISAVEGFSLFSSVPNNISTYYISFEKLAQILGNIQQQVMQRGLKRWHKL